MAASCPTARLVASSRLVHGCAERARSAAQWRVAQRAERKRWRRPKRSAAGAGLGKDSQELLERGPGRVALGRKAAAFRLPKACALHTSPAAFRLPKNLLLAPQAVRCLCFGFG